MTRSPTCKSAILLELFEERSNRVNHQVPRTDQSGKPVLNRNARPTPRSEPGECRLRFSLQLGHRLKSARRLTDFTIRSRGRAKSKSGAPADRAAGCIDRARRETRRTTCFLKVIPGRPVATEFTRASAGGATASAPRRRSGVFRLFLLYENTLSKRRRSNHYRHGALIS